MTIALFITHAVSSTVIDQVIEKGCIGGGYIFCVAEPEDVCPLERWGFEGTEGTKTPVPKTWQSGFLDYTPRQCSDFHKEVNPYSVYADEPDDEIAPEDGNNPDDGNGPDDGNRPDDGNDPDDGNNSDDGNDPDDKIDSEKVHDSRRFALLDENFTQSGDLLACNRERDDSVTSIRMEPARAAGDLDLWSEEEWREKLKLEAELAARRKEFEDKRKSRKAALARHLGSMR